MNEIVSKNLKYLLIRGKYIPGPGEYLKIFKMFI